MSTLTRTLPGTIYEVCVPDWLGMGYHRFIVTHHPRPGFVEIGGQDIWACSCRAGLTAEPCSHIRRVQAELALESVVRS